MHRGSTVDRWKAGLRSKPSSRIKFAENHRLGQDFEGFKVEFTENPKDARFPKGADAAFLPGKGKDPGTALFLKSKLVIEKHIIYYNVTGYWLQPMQRI